MGTTVGSAQLCRYGCHCVENVDHVLFHCNYVNSERRTIKDLCFNQGLSFDTATIMTQPSLQMPVERMLFSFLSSMG